MRILMARTIRATRRFVCFIYMTPFRVSVLREYILQAGSGLGTPDELDHAGQYPQRWPETLRTPDAHLQFGSLEGVCAEVGA